MQGLDLVPLAANTDRKKIAMISNACKADAVLGISIGATGAVLSTPARTATYGMTQASPTQKGSCGAHRRFGDALPSVVPGANSQIGLDAGASLVYRALDRRGGTCCDTKGHIA